MEKDLKALRIDRSKKETPNGGGRTWFLVVVAFFFGAVLAVLGFRYMFVGEAVTPFGGDDPAVAEKTPTTAEASSSADEPEPNPEDPILIATGYIVPHHRIEVGSKIVGKIAWVGVEKSDKVKKGQLLVKLEDSEYVTQKRQAQARLDAARSRLKELEAGTRPEEIQRTEAEYERSKADLENAELEYKRLESLLESRVVSKQQVDNARSRRDMAEAAVSVTERTLHLAKIGPRVEQIDSARAEVQQAISNVAYWDTQLKETEIRAPLNGTILERRAEIGNMVSTSFAGGANVFDLADLTDLQVELDISQADFYNIDVNNRCVMSPLAYKEREYVCEIAEIDPQANRQRATIQVKVQILEPDDFLRPEMDAEVTFYPPSQGTVSVVDDEPILKVSKE
jgi:HlyD family secretion protein